MFLYNMRDTTLRGGLGAVVQRPVDECTSVYTDKGLSEVYTVEVYVAVDAARRTWEEY